jgi:thiamine-monophosphate kinase
VSGGGEGGGEAPDDGAPVARAPDEGEPRLGEFGAIERWLRPLARTLPGALDLTDDAGWLALPPGRILVAAKDAMVEGRHYFPGEPPEQVARKLLRVNLSDLAAMAATPVAYLLALAIPGPDAGKWMRRFAAGLAQDQARYGVALLGGDTVGTDGPAVMSLTLLGHAPAAERLLTRGGARPGDDVWVSGTIGDAALAVEAGYGRIDLAAMGLDAAACAAVEARRLLPEPRLALGSALAGIATACADVSDGLPADLGHIAETSGVDIRMRVDLVPLSPAARRVVSAGSVSAGAGLAPVVWTGGDDYELVFTAPPAARRAVMMQGARVGVAVTRIGQVTGQATGRGRVVLTDAGGPIVAGGQPGHVHF